MAEQNSGADERVFTDEQFGAELFWAKNKNLILAAISAVVVAGLGVLGWVIVDHNAIQESQRALAQADGPDAWRAVSEKFAGRPAAAVAQLLLAESLRESGDAAASTSAYQTLVDREPDGPLTGLARLGLAENAAASGDYNRARDLFSAANSAGGFAAPLALYLSGSLLADNGDSAKAKSEFDSLRAEFPDSLPARIAARKLEEIALVTPPASSALSSSSRPAETAATPQP